MAVPTSKRPPTQEELDQRARAIFDPFAMFEACHFADKDDLFRTVLGTIDTLVWKSSTVPPKFEWGLLDDMVEQLQEPYAKEGRTPTCFNCPAFFNMIRPIMRRAHDLCVYFGFAAYAYLEEDLMAVWWYQFLTSTPAQRMSIPPPIMIIEPAAALFLDCQLDKDQLMGMGPRLPMSNMEVEWAPLMSSDEYQAQTHQRQQRQSTPTIPKGMRVAVFYEENFQAQYVSSADSKEYRLAAMALRTRAPIIQYARQRLGFHGGVDDADELDNRGTALGQSRNGLAMMMPRSPIFECMRTQAALLKARTNQEKTEGCNIQPFVLYQRLPVQLDYTALQRALPNQAAHAAAPRDMAVMER